MSERYDIEARTAAGRAAIPATLVVLVCGVVAFATLFLPFSAGSDDTTWELWSVIDIAQAVAAVLCGAAAVAALFARSKVAPLLLVTAAGLLGGAANWWAVPDLGRGLIAAGVAGVVALLAAVVAASAWPGVGGRDETEVLRVLRLSGALVATAGVATIGAGLAKVPSTWGTGQLLAANLVVVLPCALLALAVVLTRSRAVAYLLLASGAAAVGYYVPICLERAVLRDEVRVKEILVVTGALIALSGGALVAGGRPRPRRRPTA